MPRTEAEVGRGFDPDGSTPEECALATALYVGNMPHQLIPVQIRVHDIGLANCCRNPLPKFFSRLSNEAYEQ